MAEGDGRSVAPVGRAGIFVHGGRPEAVEAARMLVEWLHGHGVSTRSLHGEHVVTDESTDAGVFAEGVDLVISVGGDGTLLRAAHLAYHADAPLLGVKVGRLGFLTEIEPAQAVPLLERVLDGTVRTEDRMALVAQPIDAPWTEPQWALNEVIVEKKARHRVISLSASIGGEYVATFSGDGAIVATPTGSTAYSFSARGPIVSPHVPCLLLTPVSPHMVFDRSIVVSADEGVSLEVLPEEPGILSADGRPGLELPIGSRASIRRAERPIRLIRREGSPGFFTLLREKFSLPGEAPHVGADRPAAARAGVSAPDRPASG